MIFVKKGERSDNFMNQEKFGAFVCVLRKEKEMTQKELGNILGISDKAISKWERGVSFS